ncbi:MAG: DEAD/DEAH box helicase [bacterium]
MDFPALLKKYSIDREHLRKTFGDRSISRGVAYKWQGLVGQVGMRHGIHNMLDLIAPVEGERVYRTKVHVSVNASQTSVESTCTCPVGENCKHGIAVLYAYLEILHKQGENQLIPQQKSDIDEWLDSLLHDDDEQSSKQLALGNQNANSTVIYHLSFSREQGLVLYAYKARLLKQGGLGKETAFPLYEISDDYPYQNSTAKYWAIDTEIATILDNEGGYGYGYQRNHVYPLRGDIGGIVLRKLLMTERCFWERHRAEGKANPALRGDEPRQAELAWETKGDTQFLTLKNNPPLHLTVHLGELFYFDLKNHLVGELIHDSLSAKKIIKLLAAPPIPSKQALEVSKRMISLLPNLDVPIPADIGMETHEIRQANPIPNILLHRFSSETDEAHYVATVRYNYHQVLVSPKEKNAISIVLNDNKRYRVHRELAQEEAILAQLKSYGLTQGNEFIYELSPFDLLVADHSDLQTINFWDEFCQTHVPSLEQQGWHFILDESFRLQVDLADDWFAELEENDGGTWFEMSMGFRLGDESINLLPLLVDILKQGRSPQEVREYLSQNHHLMLPYHDAENNQRWIKLPTERLLSVIDTLVELFDTDPLNKNGNLVINHHEGLHYNDLLNDPRLNWKGAEELQALSEKIREFNGVKHINPPAGLQAELRDYQQKGLDWLQFLSEYQFGGILADDMGLGKTLQALAHLLSEKQQGRMKHPHLVIAPTSLMGNWRREAHKFTPQLNVLTLHGTERKTFFEHIHEYDLILTTYQLIFRDQDFYKAQPFHTLILDEAQAIKNAKAKTTQVIFQLQAQQRLCLTGTPMENHLGEIWSMYHFLMPGYLGTQERFTRLFRTPIEKNADEIRQRQLRKRIEPFMLRRTKDVVAKELPPKTEIIRTVELVNDQQDLYETVRLAMDKKVRDEISKKGLARSQIMILDALLKLRQVCCDPTLVKLDKARKVKGSAKLDLLMRLLPDMVAEGRKILLFSQFVSMLTLIEKHLKKKKISYSKLTGQTRKRQEAIDAFQEGDATVFLISLKAGGTGLNLTAADTVIHYDPWWNPAVEEQATDRAYRLGQDKPVFVYKLITENTVEERIINLQERKRQLAQGLYSDKAQEKGLNFDQDELMDLLRPID